MYFYSQLKNSRIAREETYEREHSVQVPSHASPFSVFGKGYDENHRFSLQKKALKETTFKALDAGNRT